MLLRRAVYVAILAVGDTSRGDHSPTDKKKGYGMKNGLKVLTPAVGDHSPTDKLNNPERLFFLSE